MVGGMLIQPNPNAFCLLLDFVSENIRFGTEVRNKMLVPSLSSSTHSEIPFIIYFLKLKALFPLFTCGQLKDLWVLTFRYENMHWSHVLVSVFFSPFDLEKWQECVERSQSSHFLF